MPVVIINNFTLLRQAVEAFDSRFTLRALRSLSTLRKSDRFAEAITLGVRTAFPKPNMGARKVLEEMLPENVTSNKELNGVADEGKKEEKKKDGEEEQQLPEIWAYLGILVQVCLGPYCGSVGLLHQILITCLGLDVRQPEV